MKWSSALPTTSGHYWLRNYIFKGMEHFAVNAEPLVVRVTGQEGRLELEGDYFHNNELPGTGSVSNAAHFAVGKRYYYNGHTEVVYSGNGHPFHVWAWDMPPIEQQILDAVFYLYDTPDSASASEDVGGTGFFVLYPSKTHPERGYLYAVTNKHVALDGFPVIRVNTQEGRHDPIPLTERNWRKHDDGDDIAVAHLGSINPDKFRFNYIELRHFLSEKIIDHHKIRPGDDCFMVGRFMGHAGVKQNLPSVRFGNISMMPIEPIKHFDGQGHLVFLVETRSLSGNSGSPVFVYFDPTRQRTRGGVTLSPPPGPWLLGVDAGNMPLEEAVLVVDDQGEIVRDEDTREPVKSHLIAQSNSGQMGVVPAWKLLELLDYGIFRKAREDGDRITSAQKSKHALRPDTQKQATSEEVEPFTTGSFEDAL